MQAEAEAAPGEDGGVGRSNHHGQARSNEDEVLGGAFGQRRAIEDVCHALGEGAKVHQRHSPGHDCSRRGQGKGAKADACTQHAVESRAEVH